LVSTKGKALNVLFFQYPGEMGITITSFTWRALERPCIAQSIKIQQKRW
jgi:hypothetical protein